LLTGGSVRRNSSLWWSLAEESLRQLSADTCFLGVDGFDVKLGLSTPNLLEAKVNRIMVERRAAWWPSATPASLGTAVFRTLRPPRHSSRNYRQAHRQIYLQALKDLGIAVTLVRTPGSTQLMTSTLDRPTTTLDEILSQPRCWTECLGALDQMEVIRRICTHLPADGEWLFIGCGTSYYIALSAAASVTSITACPHERTGLGNPVLPDMPRSTPHHNSGAHFALW